MTEMGLVLVLVLQFLEIVSGGILIGEAIRLYKSEKYILCGMCVMGAAMLVV